MIPAPSLYSHAPPQGGFPSAVGGLAATPARAGPLGSTGVRDNARTIGLATNGVVSHTLPVTLDVIGGYQGGVHELMFVECNARRSQTNRHHARSLSALNLHLRSPEARRAYSHLASAAHPDNFLARWRLYGVQKPELMGYDTNELSTSRTAAVAFTVGKEAKCFNYWLATSPGPVRPGSDLYLLARLARGEPLEPSAADVLESDEAWRAIQVAFLEAARQIDDPTGLLGFAFTDGAVGLTAEEVAARKAVRALLAGLKRFCSRAVNVAAELVARGGSAAAINAARDKFAAIGTKMDLLERATHGLTRDWTNATVQAFAARDGTQWAGLGGVNRAAAPRYNSGAALITVDAMRGAVGPGPYYAVGFLPAADPANFAERLAWWNTLAANCTRFAAALHRPPAPRRDCYWQLVPYASVDRSPPHPSLYSGPGWTGAALHVGSAGVAYETAVRTPGQSVHEARAGTFATGDQDYHRTLRNVPHVIVFMRSGGRERRA